VKTKLGGLRVVRAKPGNILDCFDIYKRGWKDGLIQSRLNEKQQADYYWTLLEELASPNHMVLLLQRGAKFYGMIHAVLVPKPLGQAPVFFIKTIYVLDSKRKRGGGKLLADELIFMAGRFGVKNFEFLCQDELVEYWAKKRKAVKVANYMAVEV
jgi:GNAT superfamily N-acetyltransferase